MLSLLSAVVVISTAFVGISIYAQTDDSELTTFEEEALTASNATSTSTDTAILGIANILSFLLIKEKVISLLP